MKGKSLSRVRLFVTSWTAAYQAPPSMGFSRQEYWSGVPLPSPLYGPSRAQSGINCTGSQNRWGSQVAICCIHTGKIYVGMDEVGCCSGDEEFPDCLLLLFWPHHMSCGMWDVSSPTRNCWALSSESTKS